MENKKFMRQRSDNPQNIAAFVFAAVFALSLSFLAASAARYAIAERIIGAQRESARFTAERQPSIFYARRGEKKPRIDFAAFGVPDADPAKKEPAAASASPAGNIKNFKLVGTLPSVGAWVELDNRSALVLKGKELDGYRLEEIEPGYAVFAREGEKFPIYLVYWTPGDKRSPSSATRAARAQPPAQAPAPPAQPAAPGGAGGVVQATTNGEDGTITRELLNELLVNPLDEVKKMRLVPSDNGMMIMGMKSDSLFNKLGMKPNDVITSVNGIGIDDVGNVSNVISSMMSGTRLDFQIERDGSPVKLGYAVK
jgi:type II secretory pathway component PulC